MSIAKRTELRSPRSADPVWWVVTGLLSAGSLALPRLLKIQSDRMTEMMLTAVALFFVGALIGSIRRDRVWRWGVAAFLAFLVAGIMQLPYADPAHPLAVGQVVARMAGFIPGYLLQALPVLAGAYVGGGLSKAGLS
jgi:hypothetical protein